MPSIELGAEVFRNCALNCWPCVRSGPVARGGDPLAGGDEGDVPDHGHQIAMASRLRPENAEAVLGVVEGDPLDEAGEHLPGR
jgi:hypothetical protein